MNSTDRYIWHETIETQHTRRSFLSEVAPEVLAVVQGWIRSDRMELPGGYVCVVLYRSEHCLEAEVLTPTGERLVRIGVADHARCGSALWQRLGGARDAKPMEPWCGVALMPAIVSDLAAAEWLADFERCLSWAWLTSDERVPENNSKALIDKT